MGQESLNMPSWIIGSLPTCTSFISLHFWEFSWLNRTTLPKSHPFQRLSIFCLFGDTKPPPFLIQSKQFWNAIATFELSRENTEHVSSVSLYYSHFLPILPHLQVFFFPKRTSYMLLSWKIYLWQVIFSNNCKEKFMLSTYAILVCKKLSIITFPNCYCIFFNQKVTQLLCK